MRDAPPDGPFDLVVVFFALQYAASSADAVGRILGGAAAQAAYGARCLVVYPDAARVAALDGRGLARAEWDGDASGGASDGGGGTRGAATWGAVYRFSLAGAIDDCPEYAVPELPMPGWEVEVDCPLDRLGPVGSADLMARMGAVAPETMDRAEREAVGLYRLVVARRDTPPAAPQ